MKDYLSLVKFSHTIFAMPFAMLGAFLAIRLNGSKMEWSYFILVILCMVFARNSAMAFNRYLDRDIDGINARTRTREIPSGIITPKSALIFVFVNALSFIACTYFINPLCLALSPIALFVVLGYSYTKRFTALSHFVLGLGLALAPIGAFVAMAGSFHLIPILYGSAVLFWVAGFDIIYSLQDIEFDVANGLHSTPSAMGGSRALLLSKILHTVCLALLIYCAFLLNEELQGIGLLHWVALLLFGGLLIYQHSLVKFNDLSKIGLAFFTTNGIASVVFASLVIIDFYF